MTGSASATRPSARACDLCKTSKIRCDAGLGSEKDCSNCRKRDIACTFNVPVKKRGPQAARTRATVRSLSSHGGSRDMTPERSVDIPTTSFEPPTNTSISQLPLPLQAQAGHLVTHSPLSARDGPPPWDAPQHRTWGSPASLSSTSAVSDIWLGLRQTLSDSIGDGSLSDIKALMHECVDLYLRHLFPTTPLIHDRTIRHTIALGFGEDQSFFRRGSIRRTSTLPLGVSPLGQQSQDHPSPNSTHEQGFYGWRYARSLSLVCAVCAFVASVVPEHLFSATRPTASPFLRASRDLLSLCHDRDIEQPESSSISIRYFNSLCIHAAGNARVSWYTLGEAMRLAQEMRLYDESSLAGLDPIECQLRRAVYWQVYTGDKSAAILNNRPFSLHPLLLDKPMSLRPLISEDVHLLDVSQPHNTLHFVQLLNEGFNLSSRLFETASTVVLDLRILRDYSTRSSAGKVDLVQGQRASVVDSLIAFRCVLDDMPDSIQRPWQLDTRQTPEVAEYQQGGFWVQHVNLKITFHCLRMIILQTASEYGFTSLLGLSNDDRLLAMEQAEIARHVLTCIQSAPFLALKLNGESCVEKIRQVGAVLLRLSQDADNPPVAQRAHADFQILLNILARLDSKASDSLSQETSAEWY